jgi:hypothetical protein
MADLFPDPSDPGPFGGCPRLASSRLRRARQDAGLSHPELARRLGWTVGRVRAIEDGLVEATDDERASWLAACGPAT